MQFRLHTLSLTMLVLVVTFAGCWRKKCCSRNHEEPATECVQQNNACEESPAAPEDIQERVSGPEGWDKDVLK